MMRRVVVLAAAVAIAVIVGVTGGLIVTTGLEQSATNAELRSDVDDLQAQLKAEGIEPVVPSDDGPVVAVDGEDGEDGSDGVDGLTVVGPPGPQGEPGIGKDGADGQDGKDGADGQDSTVPGPQGPPGETVVGPPGPAGADAEPMEAIVIVVNGVRFTCADPDGDGVYGNPCTTEVVP
jgi:hypothetical protein